MMFDSADQVHGREESRSDEFRRAGEAQLARAYGTAKQLWIAYISASGPSPAATLNLAVCELHLGNLDECLELAIAASEARPDWPHPHQIRAKALEGQGQYAAALRAVDVGIRVSDIAKLRVARAEILTSAGKYKAADRQYAAAIRMSETEADDALARVGKGILQIQRGFYKSARSTLAPVAARGGHGSDEAAFQLGRADYMYWFTGEGVSDEYLERARVAFLRCLELNGAYGRAWTSLGLVTRQMGAPTAAIPQLERGIELGDRSSFPLLQLGYAYLECGQPELAIEFALKSLRVGTPDPEPWDVIALAARLMDFEGGTDELVRKARVESPSRKVANVHAALLEWEGRDRDARAEWSELAARFDDDTVILRNAIRFEMLFGELDRATEYLDMLVETAPALAAEVYSPDLVVALRSGDDDLVQRTLAETEIPAIVHEDLRSTNDRLHGFYTNAQSNRLEEQIGIRYMTVVDDVQTGVRPDFLDGGECDVLLTYNAQRIGLVECRLRMEDTKSLAREDVNDARRKLERARANLPKDVELSVAMASNARLVDADALELANEHGIGLIRVALPQNWVHTSRWRVTRLSLYPGSPHFRLP